jgi:hypothetical protein
MKIKLNNKFYSREMIEVALKDFKEACEGKILNNDLEIELMPKENVDKLNGEFCNYVLGLMKNRMLV